MTSRVSRCVVMTDMQTDHDIDDDHVTTISLQTLWLPQSTLCQSVTSAGAVVVSSCPWVGNCRVKLDSTEASLEATV